MPPKSGLFAGEVTEAAPAAEATTAKQKGYQWMEYGNIFSPESTDCNTGGVAATQYNWHAGSPNFTHPFAGDSFDEFTMSYVGKLTSAPTTIDGLDNSQVFSLKNGGDEIRFVSMKLAGSIRIRAGMGTQLGSGNIFDRNVLIDSTWDDWWWFGASYSKTLSARSFYGVNLETGAEVSGALGGGESDLSIAFEPKVTSDNTPDSVCNWGFDEWQSPNTNRYYKGYLSQVFIHNKYIDFSVAANRRKFCALDGVIPYGIDGSIPLGEQPLVYLANGHPSSNTGLKFIGTWDTDFWINPARVAGGSPPIGT